MSSRRREDERTDRHKKRRRSPSSSKSPSPERHRSKKHEGDKPPQKPKEEQNFEKSGLLDSETATFKGRDLKWEEPEDMKRPPAGKWMLFVFKGEEMLKEPYKLRNPAFMFGRDHKICDFPMMHPSCSSQHAVLVFRSVVVEVPLDKNNPDKGMTIAKQNRPYLMDLESTNGTFVNKEKIPPACYYELRSKDLFTFGTSTREWVLMDESESSVRK
eukprot:TRINITY_DN37558_c0_g1_i1.p1 TRINITY_DN37558_c0_g1~~TRINITY_DN37558_c0_g1_i1.p1  ORF type:complete len:227 (-),score=0.56 TRINITY_DN37558_c0_g1_i1:241-885(-)